MATKSSTTLPTVRIQDPAREGDYLVINHRDFDPARHTLVGAAPAAATPPAPSTPAVGTPPASDPAAPSSGAGDGAQTPDGQGGEGGSSTATAGDGAPAFLQGITRPVLEAMKYQDLVQLAAKGNIKGIGKTKDVLVAELAALAQLS